MRCGQQLLPCALLLLSVSLSRRSWLRGIGQFHDFRPIHLLSPCKRSGPRLRVRLNRIGAARDEQFRHFDASPPACPSEWCALEKLVTNVETSAGIEQ